ncbi:glycosyltransferase [Candidatus Woesearchaeota archaeon]|nr:glycosyltransferase [Candidatus Woesearchaeota archaeon]
MKILYISPKVPYPLSDGGKLRVFNNIKHLCKKHNVVTLSFIKDKKELKGISNLKKLASVETIVLPRYRSWINSFFGLFSKKPLRVSYFKDKNFRKKAKKLSKQADIIIIQSLRMTQYAFYPEKTIVDIVDTPSLQIKRALRKESFIWKLIWKIELPRIIRFEKKIAKKFKKIVFASKADENAMCNGVVLKNSTSIDNIDRKDPNKNNIMFLGNMEYPPNIDAVNYFVNKIFPLIKKEIRDAKFYIVGKNPKKIKFKKKDIVITGFVPNLNEYFSRCKVFAAPLRIGSGIQNKVLEALNYEIPIVTTSIVNAGVEAKEDKEILIANNAEEFAEHTIRLLKDSKLRKRLSSEGKKFLKKNYSEEKINKELDKIIKK